MATCPHLWSTREFEPAVRVCAECVALGDTWVHLRLCLTCGNVACCDQSVNKHASGHYRASGHPVAKTIQPGEAWRWCYEDLVMDDPDELEMEGADLS